MESLRINLDLGFRKSLFKRLGLLVVVFTIALVSIIWYQFNYSHTTQDSILDAHETYFYSEMVSKWGNPPDTNLVIKEIDNLQMQCGIFLRNQNAEGRSYPGKKYWSNLPDIINVNDVLHWTTSRYFEKLYEIDIPLLIYFAEAEINSMPITIADNGDYLFYLAIDYIPPAEINNLIFATILSILFIIGLYFFISKYLRPVQLMKNRITALEKGDLKSKIDILGKDELADLSHSMNKLISDIDHLLENKHQLLLEVSHELRSPLARMQLLIAMIPDHKNIKKLKVEIEFLEGMISNLLLSDRLSLPYSKLEIEKYTTREIVSKTMDMFALKHQRIKVDNHIPDEQIYVDETKFTLALRNLLDNAIKYSFNNTEVDLIIIKNQDSYIEPLIQFFKNRLKRN